MASSPKFDENLAKVLLLEETWKKKDAACALVPEDHAALTSTYAIRRLIVDSLLRSSDSRDFYNACGRLGFSLGNDGATPTLAASTMDNLGDALADTGESGKSAPWIVS